MSLAADTSLLIAATVADHEHHGPAHGALKQVTHLPGTCLAETWSVLTRAFGLDSTTAGQVVNVLVKSGRELLTATPDDFREVFRTGSARGLRGDIHDAVVWRVCQRAGVDLLTLDRRWVQRAGDPDRCRYLLDEELMD